MSHCFHKQKEENSEHRRETAMCLRKQGFYHYELAAGDLFSTPMLEDGGNGWHSFGEVHHSEEKDSVSNSPDPSTG